MVVSFRMVGFSSRDETFSEEAFSHTAHTKVTMKISALIRFILSLRKFFHQVHGKIENKTYLN